jgi:GH43 family beta-xylosidase
VLDQRPPELFSSYSTLLTDSALHRKSAGSREAQARFINPILPAHAADPWVTWREGFYYHCESRNYTAIYIRKARCFTEFNRQKGFCVWRSPHKGLNSRNLWAPELHFIQGRWHIHFAADDGRNENHRMWVLESVDDNPQGPYLERGCLQTGGWAIDGTILELPDGQLFYIWSGWPGKVNGLQNLYISEMENPFTLRGPRVRICTPDQDWERIEMPIAEGPQILKRNGMTFIVYSASGSWSVDYCLGLLTNRDGDLMNPASWEKTGPVFRQAGTMFGVGHCSFVRSPDGTQDWIIYHAKSKQKKGWLDRNVHAQPFTWTTEGLPFFGQPVGTGTPIAKPTADFPASEQPV